MILYMHAAKRLCEGHYLLIEASFSALVFLPPPRLVEPSRTNVTGETLLSHYGRSLSFF